MSISGVSSNSSNSCKLDCLRTAAEYWQKTFITHEQATFYMSSTISTKLTTPWMINSCGYLSRHLWNKSSVTDHIGYIFTDNRNPIFNSRLLIRLISPKKYKREKWLHFFESKRICIKMTKMLPVSNYLSFSLSFFS